MTGNRALNPGGESQQLNVESDPDSEVFMQLVPQLLSLRRRISVGLTLIVLATVAGVGFGRGYVAPDPFPSDFEVREVIVSSAENDTDVYLQFAVANHGRRDVQLDRVYPEGELSQDVAALAEFPQPIRDGEAPWGDDIHGYTYGVHSFHTYISRKQDKTLFFDSSVGDDRLNVAELTRDLEALPIVVPAGNSIIVALVIPAASCDQSPSVVGSIMAEVRFASFQRLSPTRTERFGFSDDISVLAVVETGEMSSPASIADAICEVAG